MSADSRCLALFLVTKPIKVVSVTPKTDRISVSIMTPTTFYIMGHRLTQVYYYILLRVCEIYINKT